MREPTGGERVSTICLTDGQTMSGDGQTDT